MPVASEIASMLEALEAPAMLIRPEDMTVAAVNDAFGQAYGRFRFEGKRCWEALHRAGACPKLGLACPLAQAGDVPGACCVHQTLYGSARMTELTVTARPVLSSDGKPIYWLETIKTKNEGSEPFRRGTVGVSRLHGELMHKLERAALHDAPYLIFGETGLGKELYARTVHENSARAAHPFVVTAGERLSAKDAAALLLGRDQDPGLLRRAEGGTLFIKDIEKTALAARELLERVYESGAAANAQDGVRPVSVRLAASAERELPQEGLGSALRTALSENSIRVPPLRERKDDIAPLAKFFVSGFAPVNSRTITQEAIECLRGFDWPGNMRELREVLAKAAEAADGATITSSALSLPAKEAASFMGEDAQIVPLADIKDRYLLWAVKNFAGARSELAQKLGVSERTLYRLYAQSKSRRDGQS